MPRAMRHGGGLHDDAPSKNAVVPVQMRLRPPRVSCRQGKLIKCLCQK